MPIPSYHVDAFAQAPFSGNPAGVCLLDSWPEDELLQNIAAENNLSETAFVVAGKNGYELKWFSPAIEIDLCGHATLAAAFVLDLTAAVSSWPVRFATRSGMLSVSKEQGFYFLDFPSRPAVPCAVPPELISGLGLPPREVRKSRDYLAVFDHEEEVAGLTPDVRILKELDCLGIIVTAPGREVDFVSRFFAPRAGIDEDPVTGSSHCTLIPYWAEKTGKNDLVARQISKRGGELICENYGQRVRIGGRAVLYKSGMIEICSG